MQTQQHLAQPNGLTLHDVQLGNDAAVPVLHRLTVAGDSHDALCGRASVQRRQRRPSQQTEKEDSRHHGADPDLLSRGVRGAVAHAVH